MRKILFITATLLSFVYTVNAQDIPIADHFADYKLVHPDKLKADVKLPTTLSQPAVPNVIDLTNAVQLDKVDYQPTFQNQDFRYLQVPALRYNTENLRNGFSRLSAPLDQNLAMREATRNNILGFGYGITPQSCLNF